MNHDFEILIVMEVVGMELDILDDAVHAFWDGLDVTVVKVVEYFSPVILKAFSKLLLGVDTRTRNPASQLL